MKLIKDQETGIYSVRFKGADGKTHLRTTKTTSKGDAMIVVEQAGVAKLEMAAKANALTAETVTAIVAGRKITAATATDQWLDWLRTNREISTVTNHGYYVAAWLERLDAKTWPIARLTEQHVDSFINEKSEATAATRGSRLAAIRSFFLFCSARGYIVGNPAALVEVRLRDLTHEQKEPKKRLPITADEYRQIMAWPTVELDTALGRFMHAATAIGYWTGLRLSDIASLEWPCFNGTELIVWTGKRDKRVALPLSDPLIGSGELKMILLGVAEDARPGARYLFPDAHKIATDPTDRAKLSVYYGRLLERIGIEGKSFHCLRHAFVTRLKKAGVTIEEIGRVVGHSNTRTTEGYAH